MRGSTQVLSVLVLLTVSAVGAVDARAQTCLTGSCGFISLKGGSAEAQFELIPIPPSGTNANVFETIDLNISGSATYNYLVSVNPDGSHPIYLPDSGGSFEISANNSILIYGISGYQGLLISPSQANFSFLASGGDKLTGAITWQYGCTQLVFIPPGCVLQGDLLVTSVGGQLTPQFHPGNVYISAIQLFLNPHTPGALTVDIGGVTCGGSGVCPTPPALAVLNPYACSVNPNSCNAPLSQILDPVDSSRVLFAPPASKISADGQSAGVIAFHSGSSSPVQFDLSSPGVTGSLGGLADYDANYLNGTPGGGGGILTVMPSYCTQNSSNVPDCVFLALYWPPSTMPNGGAATSSGAYKAIPVTIKATQNNSVIAQSTLDLQPPPLVLVHGFWSSAAQAWPGFTQWLNQNYAHDLVFMTDYGRSSNLAYSDPLIQNDLDGAISNALSTAAGQGVITRSIDVVAHSMAGLVTEFFADSGPPYPIPVRFLGANPIHQLITIGTPYDGSPAAQILWNNKDKSAVVTADPIVSALCAGVTLGGCFARLGKPVDTAVQSMIPGPQPTKPPNLDLRPIVGLKPTTSTTEDLLNRLIGAFLPGLTIDNILGLTSDTIVPSNSQDYFPTSNYATISGIVHSNPCGVASLAVGTLPSSCSDTGETESPCFWAQAAYWLMGGSGKYTAAANCVIDPPNAVLDLTGYTQVPASNVSFSPVTGSALTINSPTSVSTTSPTKTITEVLLFQTVSNPADTLLLYSTQSPFSIAFMPGRMGSTVFTAFAVFSDMTYATTTLNYTFQLPGNPVALNLVNAPAASLAVGSSAMVGAQAAFSNGPVDVTQVATYKARSGTTSIFSVDSTGMVKGNGPGTDWLDVSYGGLQVSALIGVDACTFTVSPVNQIVDHNGGSLSVQVMTQPGCTWTAYSNAPWLSISNPTQTGPGTISAIAAPNSSVGTQVAIIRVADQGATATQPVTACTYVLSQTQINLSSSSASGSIAVTTSCPITVSSTASWLIPVVLSNSVGYTVAANRGAARSATLLIGTQTVTVTQAAPSAPTSTTLASSANPSNVGQTLTFTATVTSTTAGTPAGTVSFSDGGNSLGSPVALDNMGKATLTTSTLSVGGHTITATYSGDSSCNGSTSNTVTQVVNAPDFTISLQSTSLTVTAGQSVNLSVTVTPVNGSTQTIGFTCNGLPTASSCYSAAVTLNGSTAQTVMVTLQTTKRSITPPISPRVLAAPARLVAIGIIGIAILVWLIARSRRPQVGAVMTCAILILASIVLIACAGGGGSYGGGSQGGGSGGGTPAGTYNVSVTGTSGSDSHTTTIDSITVN